MKTKYDILFPVTDCLSDKEFVDYANNKLSGTQLRKVESHIADCEICADMLEGYSYLPEKNSLPGILNSLNTQILSRIKPAGRSVNMRIRRNFAIAASVALLLSVGLITKLYFNISENDAVADKIESPTAIMTAGNYTLSSTESLSEENLKEEKQSISSESLSKDNINNSNSEIEVKVENNEETEVTSRNKKEDKKMNSASRISSSVSAGISKNIVSNKNAENNDEDSFGRNNEKIATSNSDVNNIREVEAEEMSMSDDYAIQMASSAAIEEKYSDLSEVNESKKTMFFSSSKTRSLHGKQKKSSAEESETDTKTNRAFHNYQKGNYKDSGADFDDIAEENILDNEALFYAGMSYYNLTQFQKAIEKFDTIIKRDVDYKQDALWYKALSLMKWGQKQKALECFVLLSKIEGTYKEQSLKKIDELSKN